VLDAGSDALVGPVVLVADGAAGDDHAAPVGAGDDWAVEAAPVVVAGGGDRLVVDRDQGAVNVCGPVLGSGDG
jgi:hypothetical protein